MSGRSPELTDNIAESHAMERIFPKIPRWGFTVAFPDTRCPQIWSGSKRTAFSHGLLDIRKIDETFDKAA